MLEMSLILATRQRSYVDLATKFLEHFAYIASAAYELWNAEDAFFYDVIRQADGVRVPLKVRSVVGLLPLCAVSVYSRDVVARLPKFIERVTWFNENRPDLLANLNKPGQPGVQGRFMMSLLTEEQLRRVLARMLDPKEFLGDHGIRSVSRVHLDNPYVFYTGGQEFRVNYLPAESDSGMFGGNSNWRGPVWAPINALIVRALVQMYGYYGDDFKIECPTGSGQHMTLYQVAEELVNRLGGTFLLNHEGRRPIYGGTKKFVDDPLWRDNVQFYEYIHGDNGAGLGASHQTGWTAVIPALIHLFAQLRPEMLLAPDRILSQLAQRFEVEAPGASP